MTNQMTIAHPTLLVRAPEEQIKNLQPLLACNFTIVAAHEAEPLASQAYRHAADCIMVDHATPNLASVIASLSTHFLTCRLPIIVVCHNPDHINQAYAAGADDYVISPFIHYDLITRILINIQRATRVVSVNPLTHLPGNNTISKVLAQRLTQPLALLYIDIDTFKIYNDTYGFACGDNVLQYTASLLSTMTQKHGNQTDFVGNIGGDDFVIISTPDKAETIAQIIAKTFDRERVQFYTTHDRLQKKVMAHNRQGVTLEYPLLAVSIAIVTNEKRTLTSVAQISQIAAELKNYAKTKPGGVIGSNYVKDRRCA